MITNKINCLFEFGNANVYNDLGGSPELLTDLCQWFQKQKQNIFSIDIALYLFNNEYLFSILKDLADHGCRVHIYSIPLEGYDNTSPLEITNHISNVPIGRYTKLDLAKKIYETIKDLKHPNLTLHIVPHMYIRSKYVKPFSRGDMPYSLHCKTFMIQFHNGNFYGGLTSSNFAVRDAQKIELACIMPLGKNEIASSTDFYYGLRENSIPISDFDPNADYTHYTIKLRNVPENSQTTYIAPFYDHSAVQFENKLIQLIRQAKHRIIIAAQHISSYQYTYLGKYSSHDSTDSLVMKEGFLSYVLQKVREGVPAVFLSQTYADQTDRPYIRKTQNHLFNLPKRQKKQNIVITT